MQRHLEIFLKRTVAAPDTWDEVFGSISAHIIPAVILLLIIFHMENVAIGLFVRKKGMDNRSLADNEMLWLLSLDGAAAFRSRHRILVSMIQGFTQEDLLQARLLAQLVLLHSSAHYFLVSINRGGCPTESDLTGDRALQVRWSFRLLLFVYSAEEFQTQLRKEFFERGSVE